MQVTVILSPSRNSAIPLAFGDLADVEVRMGGIISSLSGTMSMSTYTDRDRGVSKAVLFTWQVRFDPAEYRFCHVNDLSRSLIKFEKFCYPRERIVAAAVTVHFLLRSVGMINTLTKVLPF